MNKKLLIYKYYEIILIEKCNKSKRRKGYVLQIHTSGYNLFCMVTILENVN